ncbi:hypothetical protein MFIFM68171_08216 [Madurella fahalii]|uniref:Rhodopsin domain-containing protein n=1 Tax=Madurella fahalii TaxID=1157608 RepID=A0ABQ0GJV9_9PEZI
MALYTSPPPARPFSEDKPTLLTSWWITTLCAVIIVLRLMGRYIRVEKLFGEDKVAAMVLLPLFLRMAFVHPVLLYGTNNVLLVDDGSPLSEIEIWRRSIGSRLVLASRFIQPTILWLLKAVTLLFFDRLVGSSGKNRYTLLLRFMWAALAVTFLAVVISDLAECTPFHRYWQVVPDPGPQCRQGHAYLITVTVCNVLTDLLLVVFPVPIVIKSRLSIGRKTLLVLLFCLHLLTVAVAIYRVPGILAEGGYQGTRTMWASAEILVATFAANALTIGTFVRDTGVKKRRPRYNPDASTSSARHDTSRVAKKVSWDDPNSDVEHDEGNAGPATGASSRVGSRNMPRSELTDPSSHGKPVLSRTESRDSLIPRGRSTTASPDGAGGVVKTTTIQVTVSSAANPGEVEHANAMNGLVLRPADGIVTASAKGVARGSSVLLQDMLPLQDSDGQGGRHW